MALISLGEVSSAVGRFLEGTRLLATGAIAIGTTVAKVKTAAAVQYCIDGMNYTKAATDDLFTLAGVSLAAGQCCVFLLCLDASGNASVAQGAIASGTTVVSGGTPYKDAFPDPPAGTCPIGFIKVVAAAAFVPGTTALNAANITTTYYNASMAPISNTI